MNSTTKIQRIFIADPSFQDWVGHHAPYDLAVKEAIERAGLECVILANRALHISASELPAGVSPVFSRTAWGKVTTPRGDISLAGHCFLSLGRLLGLVFTGIANVRHVFPKPPRFFSLSDKISKLLSPRLAEVWRRLPATVAELRVPHWLCWCFSLHSLTEYYELQRALQKSAFGRGDLLFAHMIPRHPFGMWALAANWATRRGGEVVLLFRYPADWFSSGASPNLQVAKKLLEQTFLAGRLRGATDSDLLARDYAGWMALPLTTYPIPHLPALAAPREPDAGPLRCVSLGNARAEKGILEIFEAVRRLEKDESDRRFVFRLQVNDPDAKSAGALAAFAAERHPQVELLPDALTPDEYAALLDEADIVLAPYWREIYASRTSGVLFEALAAGKPVITTEGTWLAAEAAKYGNGAEIIPSHDPRALVQALINVADDYAARARAAREMAVRCRAMHDPALMAQYLLNAKPPEKIHPGSQILLVYPMNNLAEGKSGSCTRVLNLARFLSEKGYGVEILAPEQNCAWPHPFPLLTYPEPPTLFGLFDQWRYGKLNALDKWLAAMLARLARAGSFRLALTKAMVGKRALFIDYIFDVPHIAPYAKGLDLPLIVTAHDRHAEACTDAALRNTMETYEIASLKLADMALTVSSLDQDAFSALGVPTWLSPTPGDKKEDATFSEQEVAEALRAVGVSAPFFFFLGSAHPPNNQAKAYLKDMAGTFRERNPSWNIVIAGTCAVPDETGKNLIALGPVSARMREILYAASTAVLAPLPGGTGMSVKTIEAMSRGKVVLGSKATFRGFPVCDGQNCLIEEDPGRYPERLEALLADEGLRTRIGEAAMRFAEGYEYTKSFAPCLDFLEHWPETQHKRG